MNPTYVCNCGNAVAHAKDIMPEEREIVSVSELFKLFGDPTRAGILCALCRHNLCVGELGEVLGMTSSAISHQLRLLRQRGLICAKREGKSVCYSISDRHVEQIFRFALRYVSEAENEG